MKVKFIPNLESKETRDEKESVRKEIFNKAKQLYMEDGWKLISKIEKEGTYLFLLSYGEVSLRWFEWDISCNEWTGNSDNQPVFYVFPPTYDEKGRQDYKYLDESFLDNTDFVLYSDVVIQSTEKSIEAHEILSDFFERESYEEEMTLEGLIEN
jgi:hypothetical protein